MGWWLVVCLCAVFASIALESWAYVLYAYDRQCVNPPPVQKKLAYLFTIIGFISFALFIKQRRRLPVASLLQERERTKYTLVFGIGYIVSNVVYIVVKTQQFRVCGFDDVYAREASNTFVTYVLNDIIILMGSYNFDTHMSLFCWMVALVFMELAMSWEFEELTKVPAAFIFNYFNVKISIFVFEVYADEDHVRALSNDPKKQFLFFFYVIAKLGKQLWYSTPDHVRYSEDHKPVWNTIFWSANILEMLCLAWMTVKTCHRAYHQQKQREQQSLLALHPQQGECIIS